MDRELAVDLELFSRGGQEILNAIERQGYAVLGRRPAISKSRKLALVARAALGKLLGVSEYERRRAAHAFAILADPVATRGGIFGCRSITRAAAKNFYYAFLVLPHAKRQALCAVYAFMRRCDDIADDVKLPSYERRQRLEAWLDAFHRAESGHPTDDPVLLALTDTQRRFKIPVELLDQLAYGTGMDIQDSADTGSAPADELQVLYRTFDDLRVYCYRVASVVGLVCIRIFGYQRSRGRSAGGKSGLAFQLTNIIRDVKEDAGMGRIYLPAEDLDRFKIAPAEFRQRRDSGALRWLLAAEADRAREYYAPPAS